MTDPVSALVDEAKDFSERMTSQPWACELVERLATAIATLQGERDARGEGEAGKTPGEIFGAWASRGPALAEAAGLFVGIKIRDKPFDDSDLAAQLEAAEAEKQAESVRLGLEIGRLNEALAEAMKALEEISCPTQTLNLLWWQIRAREALGQPPPYTYGHCENHRQPGGCQLHNLQCGYPDCDRRSRMESGK